MRDILEVGCPEGSGMVGRLDPRTRICATVAFALVAVGLEGLLPLALGLAGSVGLMVAARMPAAATLRRMAGMDAFILAMLLMLPFTVPGDAVFTVAGFPASEAGALQALRIGLKANAIVLMLMVMVGTLDSVTLGHALYRLGVPAGLIHLMLFTVRYIEVIHQEYQRLRTAMKARGFRPDTSLHTYRTFGYLVGMMLVRALERSERILQAMKCRGFSGTIPILDDLRFCAADQGFAAGMAVALLALAVLDRLGWG